MWEGRARSRWALPLATLLVAGGLWMVSGLKLPHGWIMVVLGLVCLAFVSIRVVLDAQELRIEYGPFRWPTSSIRLSEIEQVRAVEIRPMAWGGWGYRGLLKLFGKAAVVLRAGEGLQLDLTGGRVFAVTVDDAATGATVLQGLLPNRAYPAPPESSATGR